MSACGSRWGREQDFVSSRALVVLVVVLSSGRIIVISIGRFSEAGGMSVCPL